MLVPLLHTLFAAWPLLASPEAAALEVRAQDHAAQALIDEVLRQRLLSGRTLAFELAGARGAERSLREKIAATHQRGDPRPSAVGGLSVDAVISPEQLARLLEQVRREYLPQADASRFTPAPDTTTVVGTGHAAPDGIPRDGRPGWRHCTLEQSRVAADAALADLRQAILARIMSLTLSTGQTIGQLFATHQPFEVAVRRRVAAIPGGDATYMPSGLCMRTVRLTRREVLALLAGPAGESGLGVDLRPGTPEEPLEVSGYGVAPPGSQARPLDRPRPEWVARFLTVRGSARVPVGSAEDRREAGAALARQDAMRKLWVELEALPLPEGGTVGDALDPERRDAVRARIGEAVVPVGTVTFSAEGGAEAVIGLQLSTLWQVLAEP